MAWDEKIDWMKLKNAPSSQGFGYGNYLGSDFNWLRGEFKDLFESGSPVVQQMVEQGQKKLGLQVRREKENIDTLGAQSGFRGANANLYNRLFETEATALGDLQLEGAQMDEQVRQQALASLMGLTQFEGGTNLAVDTKKEDVRQFQESFNEQKRQFEKDWELRKRQVEIAEDEAGGGFWEGVGNLFGGGLGILSGGAFGGVGSWLSDLVKNWLK